MHVTLIAYFKRPPTRKQITENDLTNLNLVQLINYCYFISNIKVIFSKGV